MDPNYVNGMFENGGTVVIIGLPEGTEFGIDLESWNVGPQFKGMKMIPPGLHFIYYSAVSKQNEVAPRTGFFYYFEPKELLVKKYNAYNEELDDEEDLEQIERIKVNLKDIDKSLGPYPFDCWKKWISLTQHVNKTNFVRLQPVSGQICSAPELINKADLQKEKTTTNKPSSSKRKLSKNLRSATPSCETIPEEGVDTSSAENIKENPPSLPDMIARPGTEIRYCDFPVKPHKTGATPSEISRGNIDTSYTMNFIFKQLDSVDSFLSELQYSFICFMVGQAWDSWEHWKRLFITISKAEDTLIEYPDLYSKILSIFHYQIQEVPEDLFADIVENSNFIVSSLRTLFANIADNSSSLPPALVSKADKFNHHLNSKFRWSLMLVEEDDDLPTIVQF